MIETINKRIDLFISSIDGISKDSVQIILNKFSTSISEDLDKGHLTTNVCMIAASVLKLNPKELAKELKDNLDDLSSDSSALEKLAQREKNRLKEMEQLESTVEEERLTMEEEMNSGGKILV